MDLKNLNIMELQALAYQKILTIAEGQNNLNKLASSAKIDIGLIEQELDLRTNPISSEPEVLIPEEVKE